MKFLVDENLPVSTAGMLRQEGFEADHVRELGMKGAEDQEIVEEAKEEGRIIVTRDLEFGSKEHYELGSLEGVIVIRLPNGMNPEKMSERLNSFLENCTNIIEGYVTVLEENRYRSREI